MDKSQIQERTKKLLEKAEKPEEFTKGLQELLKSNEDRDATKNYQRLIPDTGKFYGVLIPVLRIIAGEIGKFISKEPAKALILLETIKVFKILDLVMEDKDKDIKKAVSWILREITKNNPDEVAKFLMKWAKANPSRDTKWIIKDGMKKLRSDKQKEILKLIEK